MLPPIRRAQAVLPVAVDLAETAAMVFPALLRFLQAAVVAAVSVLLETAETVGEIPAV